MHQKVFGVDSRGYKIGWSSAQHVAYSNVIVVTAVAMVGAFAGSASLFTTIRCGRAWCGKIVWWRLI